jgi:choline dehydrogenase-like flavoprotein
MIGLPAGTRVWLAAGVTDMPRVTTGNTMAACVVIGERAAEMLEIAHST